MKLLVDGIFFQLSNSGIARVWRSLLPHVVAHGGIQVFMLDRGNAPAIEGVSAIPFPSNHYKYCADDSILVQKMCDHLGIDIFSSTYFTTPLSTPSLLIVHDMIPELFEFELSHRAWMEKDTAICFSQRFLCVSERTRSDLLSFYPEIPNEKTVVALNGLDHAIFRPRPDSDLVQFRSAHGLNRDYFLFVGSRIQHKEYKNSRLFFDALASMRRADFDVLCIGGEERIGPEVLRNLPRGVRCVRMELTDDELCLAYGAATALVYPSLYEGFGMPVIEAMAAGCPVITTPHGALREVAGDAACLISGSSTDELLGAMKQVSNVESRRAFREKGIAHARQFRWDLMAGKYIETAKGLHEEARHGEYDAFFQEWRRLREVQATVDY